MVVKIWCVFGKLIANFAITHATLGVIDGSILKVYWIGWMTQNVEDFVRDT